MRALQVTTHLALKNIYLVKVTEMPPQSCLICVPADAAKRKASVFFVKGVKGR